MMTFKFTAQLKGFQRFHIGDRDILRPANVVQPGMFRANPGVIEPGGNREAFENLPIIVLQ